MTVPHVQETYDQLFTAAEDNDEDRLTKYILASFALTTAYWNSVMWNSWKRLVSLQP